MYVFYQTLFFLYATWKISKRLYRLKKGLKLWNDPKRNILQTKLGIETRSWDSLCPITFRRLTFWFFSSLLQRRRHVWFIQSESWSWCSWSTAKCVSDPKVYCLLPYVIYGSRMVFTLLCNNIFLLFACNDEDYRGYPCHDMGESLSIKQRLNTKGCHSHAIWTVTVDWIWTYSRTDIVYRNNFVIIVLVDEWAHLSYADTLCAFCLL